MIRYSEVRLDAGSIKTLPDGSIKVTGQLTKTGVFSYRNRDGTERREYRPSDEVFNPHAKETFASVAVTLNHPPRPVGFNKVSPSTWKNDAVGYVGENIRQDGEYLVGDLFIRDANAIAGVKNGDIKYLSCGYDVGFYDPTPGTAPDGTRHDGIQRKIVGNHVALLPPGVVPRGGEGCSLRLDAEDNEEAFRTDDVVGATAPALDCESNMADTNPALIAAEAKIVALQGELDKTRTDASESVALKTKVTELTAENAKLLAQLSPERLDALASERAALVAVAKDAGVDVTNKTSLQVKRAIVAKKTPALATRVDAMGDDALDPVLAVYASLPHPTLATVVAPAAGGDPAPARTDAAPPPAPKPLWKIREESLARQHARHNEPSDMAGILATAGK